MIERTYMTFEDFIEAVNAAERLNLDYEASRTSVEVVNIFGQTVTQAEWKLRIKGEEDA